MASKVYLLFAFIFLLPLSAVNVLGMDRMIHKQTNLRKVPSWVSNVDRRLLGSLSLAANLVVAKDGSGDYETIQDAIGAASKMRYNDRFVIQIKAGTYREYISIGTQMKNITLIGDSMKNTIITGSRSVGGGYSTISCATFDVSGDGFIASGLAFRNEAGPQNFQAVALHSTSDRSVFYRCSFEGYQDTLYVHSRRQFYRECYIYGTIDVIFGQASVVLQNCMIYARRPMHGQANVITAQSRNDPMDSSGIVIHNSRVMAAPDLQPVLSSFKTYLGRPWKNYSCTVYMKTYIGSLVDPAGWTEMNGTFGLNTLYYGEYHNFGPGSLTTNRVKWQGYRVIKRKADASKFTVKNFIGGISWLNGTNIPFTADL